MEVLRAVRLYCCDHYGSMLWDMEGNMASQYFNVWNTCIKLTWGVTRATHTYFLDYLSGGLVNVKVDIIGRYAGFYNSLLSSPCKEVNILARVAAKDIRSLTARNLRMLGKETGGLTWTAPAKRIRKELVQEPVVPPQDAWRVQYLGQLLEERDMMVYAGEEDSQKVERVQELIDSLCSS